MALSPYDAASAERPARRSGPTGLTHLRDYQASVVSSSNSLLIKPFHYQFLENLYHSDEEEDDDEHANEDSCLLFGLMGYNHR